MTLRRSSDMQIVAESALKRGEHAAVRKALDIHTVMALRRY
jgi:hypothetical protein